MTENKKLSSVLFLSLIPCLTSSKIASIIYENSQNGNENYEREISKFRKRQRDSFFLLLVTLITSLFFAKLCFEISLKKILILQIMAVFLSAQSVVGRLGWHVSDGGQTWGEDTFQENLDQLWFRILFLSGTFCFFLSIWYS